MAFEWYYKIEGREYGPLTSLQLQSVAHIGTINGDTPLRRSDQDRWYVASKVQGLFPQNAPIQAEATDTDNVDDEFGDIISQELRDRTDADIEDAMVQEVRRLARNAQQKEAADYQRQIQQSLSQSDVSKQDARFRPCPDCHEMVSKRAEQCPTCGCPLKQDTEPKATAVDASPAAEIDGAEPNGSVDIHSLRGSFISNAIGQWCVT